MGLQLIIFVLMNVKQVIYLCNYGKVVMTIAEIFKRITGSETQPTLPFLPTIHTAHFIIENVMSINTDFHLL